jgi:hypothetical protein
MDSEEAHRLLRMLGASARLRKHAELVEEAAVLLLAELRVMGFAVDESFVRAGAVLHDCGKIRRPDELTAAGAQHEPEGEALLLSVNVEPKLARVCRSHARWASLDCSIEELLVALADKLWKGKRESELELQVIDRLAEASKQSRWEVFAQLDSCFEHIASGGVERLQRSHVDEPKDSLSAKG